MGHLLILYDLCVILVGFAALAIAGFWALKSREAYLRDFCILYSLFTSLMVVTVSKKYLSLNISDSAGEAWFILTGIAQILGLGIVIATINFFHGLYRIKAGKILTLFFLLMMVICIVLILSPYGAVLDTAERRILLGPGSQIASGWYIVSFTYAVVIGFAFLRNVKSPNQRKFVLGLLLFATVGYAESLINYLGTFRSTVFLLATESDFLFSSIPYALYGIFLLFYFLQFTIPSPGVHLDLSDDLTTEWGITGREREIIRMVLEGKSNADIAGELFISLATVKTHLHNIYRKIGVDSRFDLIARVRDKAD
jgi:DNA-binding CsgD family transcriptional regulator